MNGRERLNAVLVFLFGLRLPLLDGGQAFDRLAFVAHDSMFGEAPRQGLGIAPVLGGDIGSDGFGKIDRYADCSSVLRADRVSVPRGGWRQALQMTRTHEKVRR